MWVGTIQSIEDLTQNKKAEEIWILVLLTVRAETSISPALGTPGSQAFSLGLESIPGPPWLSGPPATLRLSWISSLQRRDHGTSQPP